MKLRSEETGLLYKLTLHADGSCLLNAVYENRSDWHPHHDLIVDWARGAKIEYWNELSEEWYSDSNPAWSKRCKYRIKPDVSEEIDALKKELNDIDDRVSEIHKAIKALEG